MLKKAQLVPEKRIKASHRSSGGELGCC